MKLRNILAILVLLLAGVAVRVVEAQRSVNTGLQFEPSTGLFHLMANAVDYAIQKTVIQACGTVVACANTVSPAPFIVQGSAPFTSASPSTITLTGLPFTSATSYVCVVANATATTHTAVDVVNSSGSSTVITGPNTITDTMNYVCAGT